MSTSNAALPVPADPKLVVRAATADEIPIVQELMNEACAWLQTTGKGFNCGVHQWPDQFELHEVQEEFEFGKFFLAYYEGQLAASFRLTERPEWYGEFGSNTKLRNDIASRMNISENELADIIQKSGLDQPAMYLHSFVVKRTFAGLGLGRKLLDWSEAVTLQQGVPYLRLDCHHVNQGLRQYYVDAGLESLHFIAENPFGGIFQKRMLQ